jgi:hypothetical protein
VTVFFRSQSLNLAGDFPSQPLKGVARDFFSLLV